MNIDSTLTKVGTGASSALAGMSVTKMVGGSGVPSMTQKDLDLLQNVSGMKFHWPPEDGEGVPPAALEIAAYRERQAVAGVRMKELTASDLANLGKSGQLDRAFMDQAISYLDGHSANGESVAGMTVKSSQGSRGAGSNGSLYL